MDLPRSWKKERLLPAPTPIWKEQMANQLRCCLKAFVNHTKLMLTLPFPSSSRCHLPGKTALLTCGDFHTEEIMDIQDAI